VHQRTNYIYEKKTVKKKKERKKEHVFRSKSLTIGFDGGQGIKGGGELLDQDQEIALAKGGSFKRTGGKTSHKEGISYVPGTQKTIKDPTSKKKQTNKPRKRKLGIIFRRRWTQ